MGYFFSISKSATETWLNVFEGLLLFCGLVLAFGAAGEYLEDHERLPGWMKWSRKPKLIFVWMVALSLFGEFAGDAGVFLFSGHLQTINDGEYADLNKEAGIARKDAADANERAGNANKDAGTARLEASSANVLAKRYQAQIADADARAQESHSMAEAARLETAKLLASIQPRDLSAKQQRDIGDALRLFAGKEVILNTYGMDSEALRLSRLVSKAMTLAGIKPLQGGGVISAVGNVTEGLWINGPNTQREFLIALRSALKTGGLDSSLNIIGGDAVSIFIGIKPVTPADAKP